VRDITVYINAGGRGTRINTVFQPHPELGITKALLRLGLLDLTLVEHHVENLLSIKPANIVVGVGDHHHAARHVEQIYSSYSDISAISTNNQLGNGGDLLWALGEFPNKFADHIVIVNVDTLLTVPLQTVADSHRIYDGELTMALTTLTGVPNENAFWIGPDGLILHNAELIENTLTVDQARPRTSYRASSAGAMMLSTDFLKGFNWCPSDGPLSLYKEIVGSAVRSQTAYAFNNGSNSFLDVGTVETWQRVVDDPTLIETYLCYSEV
jgi:NDP-sugar pyrophosphorylase family protein